MNIQELLETRKVSSVTIGESALPDRKFFCNIRSRELEGNVQGHGDTVQEAFDIALGVMQRHVAMLKPQAAPAPAMPAMPEPLRMPL